MRMRAMLIVVVAVIMSGLAVGEMPVYQLYTQDGALPIYLTTNGLANGGTVPFYSMSTYSNALPVVITGVDGVIVDGSISNYLLKSGGTMTGSLVIDTNVTDKIMLLTQEIDPEGSITTQALVTTTNGWTMGSGLSWTNLLTTVTNSVAGLFVACTNVNSAMSYTNVLGGSEYHLFKASNSFYHIAEGGPDETLVSCASNGVLTVNGTYIGVGQFYGTGALTVNETTNTPFAVSTNATYSVVTNVIGSTTEAITFQRALQVETNGTEKFVLLAQQVDPEGSITTQALVTTTNGLTVVTAITNASPEVSMAGLYVEDGTYVSNALYKIVSDAQKIYSLTTYDAYAMAYTSIATESVIGGGWATNTVPTSPVGTYIGLDHWAGKTATVTWNVTTNTPFSVSTNSTYSVVTNTIYCTSNSFFYVFNGVTNVFGGGSLEPEATNAVLIASKAYTDSEGSNYLKSADNIAVAGNVGVYFSPDSSASNTYISSTIPGLSFTTDITATGADFTAMPTSADTPDGSDPTELVNVDYIASQIPPYAFLSITNQIGVTNNLTTAYQHLDPYMLTQTNKFTCTPSNLTATVAGYYDFSFSVCGVGEPSSPQYSFAVFTNGVITTIRCRRDTGSTLAGGASLTGIIPLAVGDVVDVRARSDGNKTYYLISSQIKIHKIGF